MEDLAAELGRLLDQAPDGGPFDALARRLIGEALASLQAGREDLALAFELSLLADHAKDAARADLYRRASDALKAAKPNVPQAGRRPFANRGR